MNIHKSRHRKIGSKLKRLRKEAGFTSYENFAMEYELSRMYYWQVENGRNISLEYLFNLLNIFKVDLPEFFSDIH
jgi:transcriptional regulator with XRE-family HTH domain